MKRSTRPTILIADGVAFSRKILRMLLRADYEVVEAADGAEAVRLLTAKPRAFACVLLDPRLKGPDGTGLLGYLSRNGLTARVPAVALVPAGAPAARLRYHAAGAVGVLERPYSETELLNAVGWVVSSERRRGAAVSRAADATSAADRVRGVLREVRK